MESGGGSGEQSKAVSKMITKKRLLELLKNAVEEADGWYDDSWGRELDTPMMNEAREVVKNIRSTKNEKM